MSYFIFHTLRFYKLEKLSLPGEFLAHIHNFLWKWTITISIFLISKKSRKLGIKIQFITSNFPTVLAHNKTIIVKHPLHKLIMCLDTSKKDKIIKSRHAGPIISLTQWSTAWNQQFFLCCFVVDAAAVEFRFFFVFCNIIYYTTMWATIYAHFSIRHAAHKHFYFGHLDWYHAIHILMMCK